LQYGCMTVKKNTKQLEDVESEKALVAFGKFKGTCTFCGKIGHKATTCFSRLKEEKNGQEKHKPKQQTKEQEALYQENKCFHCKKVGHKIVDCYAKKNAELKTAQESANTAIEKNCTFVGVQSHATKTMTENTWVADSGTMCHITKQEDQTL